MKNEKLKYANIHKDRIYPKIKKHVLKHAGLILLIAKVLLIAFVYFTELDNTNIISLLMIFMLLNKK